MSDKDSLISRNGVSYLVPFILVTSCFALWERYYQSDGQSLLKNIPHERH